MTPTTSGLAASACPFARHFASSQAPVFLIVSSQAWKATVFEPAFQLACSRTSWIASTICLERSPAAPCIGRSEAMSTSGCPLPPYCTFAQDEEGRALTLETFFDLSLLLLPQAARATV